MKNKKHLLLVLAAVILVITVVIIVTFKGRGGHDATKIKVGFIMSGASNEQGWNGLHYEGISSACQELEIDLVVKENIKENSGQCEAAIRELADEDVDIIILSSYGYAAEVVDVVKEYPEITFYSESFNYYGDNLNCYSVIARIIGVADSCDAMASNRSYRKYLPQPVIRAEIEKGKETQFDPKIAEIMLQMIDEDKNYTMREVSNLQKKILVVDDEDMNIKMVEVILKDTPMYQIVGATSGMEALKILETHDIDMILLDVKMPGMDGFEAIQEIRRKYDMPIVLMTGDRKIETIERATALGVDDYLTKPFLPLALKEIIHSTLG